MTYFVINEWIWEDLSGKNGSDVLLQVVNLIERFAFSEHQLIIIHDSAFDKKAWAICKNKNLLVARIAKIFVRQIRYDSNHALILYGDSVTEFPDTLTSLVKPDDRYLVRAQLSVPGAILVTTDAKLRDALKDYGLPSITREEFLSTYFDIQP